MATPESIAIRSEAALERLNAAAARISQKTGVEAPDVPTWYRDTAELPVMQLETLTDFLEHLADAINTGEPTPDYASMTIKQLQSLADERKINLPARAKKGEIIDALKAAGNDLS